jgi:hypothetical protein
MADQLDVRAYEAIVAVEENCARPVIFVPSHRPGSKKVT